MRPGKEQEQWLTIGKVARTAEVSVETIREFQRRGWLTEPDKPPLGGLRTYSGEDLQRIYFIKRAQGAGFSLNEIDLLLQARADPRGVCGELRAMLAAKVDELSVRLDQLAAIKQELQLFPHDGRCARNRCHIVDWLGEGPLPAPTRPGMPAPECQSPLVWRLAAAAPESWLDEKGDDGRLIEQSLKGVYLMAGGALAYVNPRLAEIFGYAVDELTNLPIEGLAVSGDRARVAQAFSRPAERMRVAFRGLRKNGETVDVLAYGERAAFGDREAVAGFVVDVTSHRQTTDALRNERNFIAAVLETVGALVVVLDRAGHIVRFNRQCEKLTGFSAAEVLGRPVWELLIPANEVARVKQTFEGLLAGQFPNTLENHWRTKDGERRALRWSNTAILDAAGKPEFVVATGLEQNGHGERQVALREMAGARYSSATATAHGCTACANSRTCLPVGLSSLELDVLEEIIVRRHGVARGEAVFRADAPCERLFALRKGSLKTCLVSASGREQLLGFHLPGELVGVSGIDGGVYGCDGVALEDSEVCEIALARLEEHASRMAVLQHNLHRLMSRQIRNQHRLMLVLGTLRAEQRVAAFLLELHERMVLHGAPSRELHLSMVREEIAACLGFSMETVSRAFSRLQDSALIEVHTKHVLLHDIPALRRLVAG
ncbi:MAG: PAS domain S-box protein [Betaproteobacteria bacterium]|nr:PAS domain S-box protein [Betaproteobacteria bacterium]